jgi:photosystem II stability/assembly factor-like uncharacterized protein
MLKWLVSISTILCITCQCFGQTAWVGQQSGLTSELRAVAFFDSLTGFVAGDSCVKTTDGGKHWTLVPEITNCNDIKIDKNGVIWFAECTDLAHSTDSGKTFIKHSSPCMNSIAMHDSMITGCAGVFVIYNSFDSGKEWTECPFQQGPYVDAENGILRAVIYSSNLTGLVIGGTYDFVNPNPPHETIQAVAFSASYDSGRTWLGPTNFTPGWRLGFNEFFAAEAIDSIHFIVTGDSSFIGIITFPPSWNFRYNTLHSNGNSIYMGLYFFTPNRGFVVGSSGTILYTENQGKYWSNIPSPDSTTLNKITFTDSTNGWIVGANGVILHTDNGGWVGGTSDVKQTSKTPSANSLSYDIDRDEWILRTKDNFNGNPRVSIFSVLGVSLSENIACEKISDGEYILPRMKLTNGFYIAKFQEQNQTFVLPLVLR